MCIQTTIYNCIRKCRERDSDKERNMQICNQPSGVPSSIISIIIYIYMCRYIMIYIYGTIYYSVCVCVGVGPNTIRCPADHQDTLPSGPILTRHDSCGPRQSANGIRPGSMGWDGLPSCTIRIE